MARAKQTERAEARRRYRAAVVDGTEPVEGDDESAVTAAPRPPAGRARTAAQPARVDRGGERPGFVAALRKAAGAPDILGDIRALPATAIHSKALWIPVLVVVATTVLFFIPGMQRNPIVALLGNIALQPPPMILPFLAGMLAPRGAWLAGGVVGLVNVLAYAILFASFTSSVETPLGFTYILAGDQKVAIAINALVTAVPFGILVGAFAGFYRRFLSLSSPPRQAARQAARSNQGRRR